MVSQQLAACLDFIRHCEQLKQTLRNAHTSSGRQESSAEHSWRIGLMAMVFEEELPGLDMAELLKLCLIHDLGEAIGGDIPATQQTTEVNKDIQERADFQTLLQPLPGYLQEAFLRLWDDYHQGRSAEARLVRGLDKLETLIQHNQTRQPGEFDYGFNLHYGRRYMDAHPLLAQIRALVDNDTQQRMAETPGKAATR